MRPLRLLLAGSLDYAGLFPPAALGMNDAVRNYARYRSGEEAWMLGRFIVPVAQLAEWSAAAAALPDGPWRLGALAGDDLPSDCRTVRTFNERPAPAHAVIEALEFRADSPEATTAALRSLPENVRGYAEIPIDRDPSPLIAALREHGGWAKARTGGVKAEAFPSPSKLAGFLRACSDAGVGFKVTAGLHHPLRGSYPLTYAASSPAGIMFGFLNVLLAAGLARRGAGHEEVVAMLEERDGRSILFDASGVSWKGHRLETEDLAELRTRFAAAFGSCSFDEPVRELRQMGLL